MIRLAVALFLTVPTPGGIGETVLIDNGTAVVSAPAVRTGNTVQAVPTQPPPTQPVPQGGVDGLPFAPAGLSNCDEMNFYREQFGLPQKFSSIGWRESNCRNEDGVHTSCCHGYWQMHRQHFNGTGYIYGKWCNAFSYTDVNSDTPEDKQRQACAAKALYDEAGMSPWAATS